LVEKYKKKEPSNGQKNPTYAAMLESLDESVGRIMSKVAQLGLADRTIVIFFYDNGGLAGTGPTSNYPLRAGKGTMYEGGVREPLIVRYPNVIQAGSVCDTPVISVDFFPTLLEAVGVKPDPKVMLDGVSIWPLLKQTAKPDRDTFYWHYPHYHPAANAVPGGLTPAGSIRKGDWKLIEWYEDGKVELYDLKADPSETTDLAAKMPEKTVELKKMLGDWRKSVNAQMPTVNPAYDPSKPSGPAR